MPRSWRSRTGPRGHTPNFNYPGIDRLNIGLDEVINMGIALLRAGVIR